MPRSRKKSVSDIGVLDDATVALRAFVDAVRDDEPAMAALAGDAADRLAAVQVGITIRTEQGPEAAARAAVRALRNLGLPQPA